MAKREGYFGRALIDLRLTWVDSRRLAIALILILAEIGVSDDAPGVAGVRAVGDDDDTVAGLDAACRNLRAAVGNERVASYGVRRGIAAGIFHGNARAADSRDGACADAAAAKPSVVAAKATVASEPAAHVILTLCLRTITVRAQRRCSASAFGVAEAGIKTRDD